jgi:hypothetical protein
MASSIMSFNRRGREKGRRKPKRTKIKLED